MSTSRQIARVVLDSRLPQLNRLFDYLIPSGMDVEPGIRVRVPLRSAQRLAEGYVVECTRERPYGFLAEISEVVSPVPVIPDRLWGSLVRSPTDLLALQPMFCAWRF